MMTIIDRPASEIIQNAGTPLVALTTGSYSRLDGLRTSLSASISGTDGLKADFTNSYSYDSLLRMTGVTQNGMTGGNAVAGKSVSLTFDDAGRPSAIVRSLGGVTGPVASSAYTYDSAGRLTALTHTGPTDVLAGYAWSYDAAGRLTQTVNADGTRNYTYDPTGQLILVTDGNSATLESYTYDANGNRISAGSGSVSQTYGTPDNNHLTFDGTYTYQYDAEGNRIARWVAGASGETAPGIGDTDVTFYTWDNRNRLVKLANKAHFTDPGFTQNITYVYDTSDRRIGSVYDTNGDSTADRIERYIWDGQNVVLDFVDPDGGNNSLSEGTASEPLALVTRYLTGPAIGQVYAQETTGDGTAASVLWMLADNEGSNRDLAQYDDGNCETIVVTHYTLDSYGNATATIGSLDDTRYIWAQTQYDGFAGQYYAMARWYDPRTGGWLCEDPKGFAAGDANLGRYCGNGPVNANDPEGLATVQGLYSDSIEPSSFVTPMSPSADYSGKVFGLPAHNSLDDKEVWAGMQFDATMAYLNRLDSQSSPDLATVIQQLSGRMAALKNLATSSWTDERSIIAQKELPVVEAALRQLLNTQSTGLTPRESCFIGWTNDQAALYNSVMLTVGLNNTAHNASEPTANEMGQVGMMLLGCRYSLPGIVGANTTRQAAYASLTTLYMGDNIRATVTGKTPMLDRVCPWGNTIGGVMLMVGCPEFWTKAPPSNNLFGLGAAESGVTGKPAPVQATWLGYPGSTGLNNIDYRLSDPYLDPPGMDESAYSERTIRLPETFWCYDPLDGRDCPVNSLPALETGIVTFGCLNAFCKINPPLLKLWAQVLRQVPGSQLLLLAKPGSHRQRTLDFLKQEGIEPHRVEFIPHQERRKYLEVYHRIDLCLDTFPYNGHTTSLDSFWMGVPVVTLRVLRTPSQVKLTLAAAKLVLSLCDADAVLAVRRDGRSTVMVIGSPLAPAAWGPPGLCGLMLK